MINPSNLLQDLVKKALKNGANEADAIYSQGEGISVTVHNNKLENLEQHESHDLGLRVIVDGRQATGSISNLNSENLNKLVEKTISMAKHLPKDPYCGLATPNQIIKTIPEIDTFDTTVVSGDELISMAKKAEQAALNVKGVTATEETQASWGRGESILVASNGFIGTKKSSLVTVSSLAVAGHAPGMQTDYEYDACIYKSDLKSPEFIGTTSGNRAVRRLNPKKIKTGSFPVIFEPRIGSSLISEFAQAINGLNIARGKSFLKDSLHSQIFGSQITIIDDPLLKRGRRSRAFDAEGLPTKVNKIIENGILTTWIMDLSSAKQLNMLSTGSATMAPGSIPRPSVSNLYMKPGNQSPKDLIKSIKKGFFVTETMGNGVNSITGDYSLGASGLWIENGEIAYPVNEVTIAGNLKNIFKNITPCNDLEFRYGLDVPTLLIEGLTLASK